MIDAFALYDDLESFYQSDYDLPQNSLMTPSPLSLSHLSIISFRQQLRSAYNQQVEQTKSPPTLLGQ
jgi:hypothetical protein